MWVNSSPESARRHTASTATRCSDKSASTDNRPRWRGLSQNAPATPYSEEGAVDYSHGLPRASLQRSAANAPAPVGAGTVTRMTLDEFEALKMCAAEERRCAGPRAGPCKMCAAEERRCAAPRAGPCHPCRPPPKI
jgi:hypothetical protein